MNEKRRPILCLDFDGVIHSYTSGWQGAEVVSDPLVDGAINFIVEANNSFQIHIFSSRSNQIGGIDAMKQWLWDNWPNHLFKEVFAHIEWPTEKPPAMITIDDRAITFTGEWPDIETLLAFRPWNKP